MGPSINADCSVSRGLGMSFLDKIAECELSYIIIHCSVKIQADSRTLVINFC